MDYIIRQSINPMRPNGSPDGWRAMIVAMGAADHRQAASMATMVPEKDLADVSQDERFHVFRTPGGRILAVEARP